MNKSAKKNLKNNNSHLLQKIKRTLSQKQHTYRTLDLAKALGLYNMRYFSEANRITDKERERIRHRARVQTLRMLQDDSRFPLWRIKEVADYLELAPSSWLPIVLAERIRSELNNRRDSLISLFKKNKKKYTQIRVEYGWDHFDPLNTLEWEAWRESYLKEIGLIRDEKATPNEFALTTVEYLSPDEKEILHRYRTISPQTQEVARNLIFHF